MCFDEKRSIFVGNNLMEQIPGVILDFVYTWAISVGKSFSITKEQVLKFDGNTQTFQKTETLQTLKTETTQTFRKRKYVSDKGRVPSKSMTM